MQEIPQISGGINPKATIPRLHGGGAAGDGAGRPRAASRKGLASPANGDQGTDSGVLSRNRRSQEAVGWHLQVLGANCPPEIQYPSG